MKVFDLCCTHDHRFEGWFASEEAFADQLERALVSCPLCSDAKVRRLPSAARLNLGAAAPVVERAAAAPDAPTPSQRPPDRPLAAAAASVEMQAAWMQAVRQVLATTEDVGDRFVDEARDMHYGRTDPRGIRGQATPEQASELRDEGIEVVALPVPAALKGRLQ